MRKERSICALHSRRVEKAGMRMACTTSIYNRFRTANGSRVWTAINGNLFSKLTMVSTLVATHQAPRLCLPRNPLPELRQRVADVDECVGDSRGDLADGRNARQSDHGDE